MVRFSVPPAPGTMPPLNETKRKRKPPTHTDSETDDTPSDSIPDTIKDAVISWFNKHLTTEMDIPDALSEGVRKGDDVFRITTAQVRHSKTTLELETEDGLGLTFYGERDEDGSITFCDPWTHFEEFVGNEKRLLEMLKKVKPQIDNYSDTMYLEGTEYFENNRVPPKYGSNWKLSIPIHNDDGEGEDEIEFYDTSKSKYPYKYGFRQAKPPSKFVWKNLVKPMLRKECSDGDDESAYGSGEEEEEEEEEEDELSGEEMDESDKKWIEDLGDVRKDIIKSLRKFAEEEWGM